MVSDANQPDAPEAASEDHAGRKRVKKILLLLLIVVIVTALIWFSHYKGLIDELSDQPDISSLRSEIVIEHATLSNGMEVYAVPNPIVPAVQHMLWYKVGGKDDPAGKSGVAHFFEHMMFRGTRSMEPGEYSRKVAAVGGRENAFTSHDYTAYYATVAKEHLPTIMEMEADRMQHLQLTEAEVLRERNVILEERGQVVDSNVERLFGEQLYAALYLHHPYRRPVIGWEHEIASFTTQDVQAFYDRYYHPGNAVLVVGGDITLQELLPLAERYYGAIPAGEVIQRIDWQEPPQLAARRIEMEHAQAKEPLWLRIYQAPSASSGKTSHTFPLIVLEHLLGADKTGLLYRELVEKHNLATSVSASYSPVRGGPSIFSIGVSPAEGVEIEDIEKVVDQLLAKVQQGTPDAKALQQAKQLLMAGTIYAREGITTMARYVGMLATVGLESSYLVDWEESVEKVAGEHIREAASYVFDKKQSVTGVLKPEVKQAKAAKKTPANAMSEGGQE